MVRIVYMAHAFQVGGAEEMVLNLVRRLPRDRFEPHVCCIHEAGPIGEEIRRTGTPVTVLGVTPGMRQPWAVDRIRRYLRDEKPDIVHTFLLTASLYGRFAAALARVPVVIGSEVNIYERKQRRHILIERLLMSVTDRVIVSAESVREFYLRQLHADPAKVDVIYNAVEWNQLETTAGRRDVRLALGIPGDELVLGVIARLTEQKGHSYLLEALAGTPRLSRVHLVVVGNGPLDGELKQRADALGLRERVHFVGARRDLGNLLSAFDVFVLPSLWEGLPLSLVLAMGAGLPVVATAVAGIPEVVEHDRTGLLVPPGKTAALGEALARLTADPDLRARLGRAGRASVVPRFGVESYVTALTALYDRLLGERHRPRADA